MPSKRQEQRDATVLIRIHKRTRWEVGTKQKGRETAVTHWLSDSSDPSALQMQHLMSSIIPCHILLVLCDLSITVHPVYVFLFNWNSRSRGCSMRTSLTLSPLPLMILMSGRSRGGGRMCMWWRGAHDDEKRVGSIHYGCMWVCWLAWARLELCVRGGSKGKGTRLQRADQDSNRSMQEQGGIKERG